MKTKIKITTINDEISENIDETIDFLKSNNINYVEIRSINKKNLVDYSLDEVTNIYNLLKKNNIKVSALAAPLFKWYPDKSTKEAIQKVDTFNFNPDLSIENKKEYIKKAMEVAKALRTKNVRIFSSLKTKDTEYNFSKDPLLVFALEQAKNNNINLLIENEPPCYINKMVDIKKILKEFRSKGLGLWFDVANFYKINEQVFLSDIEELKDDIKYIHFKDFDINNNYVPVGDGVINYKRIISDIKKVFNDKDIFISIETHVHSDPKNATLKSIKKVEDLIKNDRVGYGIIGCGQVFKKHGSSIGDNDNSELRAIYDLNKKRALEIARSFDCELKNTAESLIEDNNIRVVNIRTPNDTHLNYVLETLKNKKFCLCEKPMTLTTEEGLKITKNKLYKKNVFINFQNRFNPAVVKMFELINSGKLGKIKFCSINLRWWRDDKYFIDWHGNKERVGGMLYNQGAHALDILHNICGEVKNIKSLSKKIRKVSNIDDIFLAIIQFKNGIVGNLEINSYTKFKNCEASIFIIGEKGSIKLSGQSFNKIEFVSLLNDINGEKFTCNYDNESSHYKLISALNNLILKNKENHLLANAEDGLINTRLIEKLYKNSGFLK